MRPVSGWVVQRKEVEEVHEWKKMEKWEVEEGEVEEENGDGECGQ